MQRGRKLVRTLIIAEAGVNHNGSLENAFKLVDAAKMAGADIVKFQTFRAEELVSCNAQKAEYQNKSNCKGETQLEMLKSLELTKSELLGLHSYCAKKKILFLSTPFDFESIDVLEELNMPIYKIPSGEITNLPYLIKIATLGKPVILSTGMSTLDEIESAVNVLKNHGVIEISILHCNTEYPTPYEDVNLLAMNTLKKQFGVKIGYSDHTIGIEIPIAAVALGAEIIEKHFTLDKSMEGPDHKASLEPAELKKMIDGIRNVENAFGDGRKVPSKSEIKNMNIARKSIVAKTKILAGDIFSEDNITVKRPGNGISPMQWFNVLGQTAKRNFEEDEFISL